MMVVYGLLIEFRWLTLHSNYVW